MKIKSQASELPGSEIPTPRDLPDVIETSFATWSDTYKWRRFLSGVGLTAAEFDENYIIRNVPGRQDRVIFISREMEEAEKEATTRKWEAHYNAQYAEFGDMAL